MKLKIGILGAGRIAEKLAKTFSLLPEVQTVAVGARDLKRAQAFAFRHGIERAYGSYEALAADPAVELIYIATPHAYHYDHMMLCLQAGKHILCEKAFTCTAAEAKKVVEESRKRKLFVAEAMWTRYMPMVKHLETIRQNCPVGEIVGLTANLSYPVYAQKERVQLPELGGGALLDVGIYPLTIASIVMGDEIEAIYSNALFSDTGVDVQNTTTLHYAGGKTAVLTSSVLAHSDRKGIIFCTEGYIEVENINNFERVSVFDNNHRLLQCVNRASQQTGYEYEVLAAVHAIESGGLECAEMPVAETVKMMQLMDQIRHQWNFWYPGEQR